MRSSLSFDSFTEKFLPQQLLMGSSHGLARRYAKVVINVTAASIMCAGGSLQARDLYKTSPGSEQGSRDLEPFQHGVVADNVKLHVIDQAAGDDEITLQLLR